MKQLIFKIYQILPRKTVNFLGKIKFLKPLRDFFLKDMNEFKVIKTAISLSYEGHNINFDFIAPIKIAARAKRGGIEYTLINNSIKLFNKYGSKINNARILDVGANFGFLSTVWSKSISREAGQVYSFEPSKNVSEVFKKTIKENNLTAIVKLYKNAVGSKNEFIEINDSGVTSNVLEFENSNEKNLVEMITIDSFIEAEKIEKMDLFKIDVDGIEYDILKGAESMLRKHMPILIVETNDDIRIIDFCKEMGYQILDMNLIPYEKNTVIPENIFCVKKETYLEND
jgi:FkbM family methyltransferase